MFLLFPLLLAAWCFYKKDSHLIPVIVTGIVAAVLVCGFKAFFLYSHRIIPYSFERNVLYLLVRQTLLPVVLLYGIFFAWSKDSISYKIESFFPLLISFYMLYLPYTIISTSDGLYTSFPLFVKPVLFVVMIFSLGLSAKHIEKTLKNKKIFFAVYGVELKQVWNDFIDAIPLPENVYSKLCAYWYSKNKESYSYKETWLWQKKLKILKHY